MAARLAIEDSRVAEGIYVAWALPLIESADLVVWLDPPRWKWAAASVRASNPSTLMDLSARRPTERPPSVASPTPAL